MTTERIIAKQAIEIENLKEQIRDYEMKFQTIREYISEKESHTSPQVTLNKITHQLPRA